MSENIMRDIVEFGIKNKLDVVSQNRCVVCGEPNPTFVAIGQDMYAGFILAGHCVKCNPQEAIKHVAEAALNSTVDFRPTPVWEAVKEAASNDNLIS